MDPDATLTALCEALRDRNRERCWEALEALNDWLAKGGAFPDKVRAVPLSETDLAMMIVGAIGMVEEAKKGICPIPGTDAAAQYAAADLGSRLTGYVTSPATLEMVGKFLKASLGLNPNKPL